MRGQTTMLVLFRFGLRATYFLHTKKVGKDVPRGVSLEPRMVLIFRAIVGHHNGGGDRPQCPQYREPFRGEAGVLFRKVGGYGIF